MRAIGDNIVELSLVALAAFAVCAIVYLIHSSEVSAQERYKLCIDAGKQYVEGSCVE